MKILIYSPDIRRVNVKRFIKLLSNLKDLTKGNLEIRLTGSKGLEERIINAVELKNVTKTLFIPWQFFNKFRSTDSDEDVKLHIRCPRTSQKSISFIEAGSIGKINEEKLKLDNRLIYGMLGPELNDSVDLIFINNVDSSKIITSSSALLERVAINEGIPVINLESNPTFEDDKQLKKLIDKLGPIEYGIK